MKKEDQIKLEQELKFYKDAFDFNQQQFDRLWEEIKTSEDDFICETGNFYNVNPIIIDKAINEIKETKGTITILSTLLGIVGFGFGFLLGILIF